MKYILLGVSMIGLAACKEELPSIQDSAGSEYSITCIGGVEYYKMRRGYAGYMAIRVDAETMSFVKC